MSRSSGLFRAQTVRSAWLQPGVERVQKARTGAEHHSSPCLCARSRCWRVAHQSSVVITTAHNAMPPRRIYIPIMSRSVPAEGAKPRPWLNSSANEHSPRFSPDGWYMDLMRRDDQRST